MRSTLQGVFFPWDGDCHPMLKTLIDTGDAQWQIYMKFSQSDHTVESQSAYDLAFWAVNETAAGGPIEKTQYTFAGVGNNKPDCSAVMKYGEKLFESGAQTPDIASDASRVLDTRQFLFAPQSKPQRQTDIEFPPQCKTGYNFAVDRNPDDLFLRKSLSYECWAGKSPGPLVFQLSVNMPLPKLSGNLFEPFGWALSGGIISMIAAFVIFLLTPWSALPNGMPDNQKSWPMLPRMGTRLGATTPGKNPATPFHSEEEVHIDEEKDHVNVNDLPNVPSNCSSQSPLTKAPVLQLSPNCSSKSPLTKAPVLQLSPMVVKRLSPSCLANGSVLGIGPSPPMFLRRSSTEPLTQTSVLGVPIDASPMIVQRTSQPFEALMTTASYSATASMINA